MSESQVHGVSDMPDTEMLRHLLARTSDVAVREATLDAVTWAYVARAADLDGDGIPEIYCGADDGSITAIDHWGALRWRYQAGDKVYDLSIADIDRDGYAEIVAGSGNRDRAVYALTHEGEVRWRWQAPDGIRSVCVAELRGDGTRQVIAGSDDGFVYILTDAGQLEGRLQLDNRLRCVRVADFSGDGRPEIVTGGDDRTVSVLDARGNICWSRVFGNRIYSIEVTNIVGGDRPELLIGTQDGCICLVDHTGAMCWEHRIDSRVFCVHAADADGDGYTEVLVGSEGGLIYVLTANGARKWVFQAGSRVRGLDTAHFAPDATTPRLVVSLENEPVALYRLQEPGSLLDKLRMAFAPLAGRTLQQLGLSRADSETLGALLDVEVVDESAPAYAAGLSIEQAERIARQGDPVRALSTVLRMRSGLSLRWRFDTSDMIYGLCATDLDRDGRLEVVAGIGNGQVCVLDARGQVQWGSQAHDRVRSVSATDLDGDGQPEILCSTDNRRAANIELLDASGERVQEWVVGSHARAFAIAALKSQLVIVGSEDGHVYAVAADGRPLWEYKTTGWVRGVDVWQPDDGSEALVVAGSEDGSVCLFEANGRLRWRQHATDRILSVHIVPPTSQWQGGIAAGLEDGRLYLFRLDGILDWMYNVGDRISTVFAADLDRSGTLNILAGTADGRVLVFSRTGELQRVLSVGAWVRSVYAADLENCGQRMELLVGTSDGHLYAFEVVPLETMDRLAENYWAELADRHGDTPRLVAELLAGSDEYIAAYALRAVARGSILLPELLLDTIEQIPATAADLINEALAGALIGLFDALGDHVSNLAWKLAQHPAPSVRLALVTSLIDLIVQAQDPFCAILLELGRDAEPTVRRAVCRGAGRLASQTPTLTLELLCEVCQDENEWIQHEVAHALVAYLEPVADTETVSLDAAAALLAHNCQPVVFNHAAMQPSHPQASQLYRFLYMALTSRVVEELIQIESLIEGPEVSGVLQRMFGADAWQHMREIIAALAKLDKVDDLSAKLQYALQAVSLIEATSQMAVNELPPNPGQVLDYVLSRWRHVVASELTAMRYSARLEVRIVTKRLPAGRSATVVLEVANRGAGLAEKVTVSVIENKGYEISQRRQYIPLLLARQERQLEFEITPSAKGQIRFVVEVTYDDLIRQGQRTKFADTIELFTLATHPFRRLDPNPYVVGRPLQESDVFVGREDVFETIRHNLSGRHRDNIIVIYGQRRCGKTSILYQLRERLSDRYVPVLIDMQGMLDEGTVAFLFTIAHAIHRELERRGLAVPAPSVADFQQLPGHYFRDQYLVQVQAAISDRSLLLMFDEFELLGQRVEQGKLDTDILDYLRNLMQHSEQLDFIFAGTHKLEEMSGDYWSILFNIAIYIKIAFLDLESAQQLITEPVAGYFEYDELALEKILQAAAQHPHFTQLLCHSLVTYCNEHKIRYITVHEVNAMIDQVVETGGIHIDYLWRRSSPDEKLLLVALNTVLQREGRATFASLRTFLAQYKIATDVAATLQSLMARDIVAQEGNSYRFKIDLVRYWIARNKTIQRALREIYRDDY